MIWPARSYETILMRLHLYVFIFQSLIACCSCDQSVADLKNDICHSPYLNFDRGDDSYLHRMKGDSIYVNLMLAKHEKDFTASFFIREIFEATRCDRVYNMTDMRHKYVAKINVGDQSRMCRILNHKEDLIDVSFTTQVKWKFLSYQFFLLNVI